MTVKPSTSVDAALAAVPLAICPVDLPGFRLDVAAVRDQQALLDAADGFSTVPYGLLLWESAIALSGYLCERPGLVAGREVLELGAGVGLSGLTAARLGAHVTLSDHEPAALEVCRRNAMANAMAPPRTIQADWRNWPETRTYQVILGADIVYEREIHTVLVRLLATCTRPGGCILLTDPGRPHTLEFLAALEDEGWRGKIETRNVPALTTTPGGSPGVEITIAELWRPA